MSKSATIDIFESTLQKTNEWLHDLMTELDWDNRYKAYSVLRGTLQALRDRLPLELAVKFGAQLPMLVRGFYYEGWKPSITPIKVSNKEEFLNFVLSYLKNPALFEEPELHNIEKVVSAVFKVIANHVSEGEVHHLKSALPAAIGNLWPYLPVNINRD